MLPAPFTRISRLQSLCLRACLGEILSPPSLLTPTPRLCSSSPIYRHAACSTAQSCFVKAAPCNSGCVHHLASLCTSHAFTCLLSLPFHLLIRSSQHLASRLRHSTMPQHVTASVRRCAPLRSLLLLDNDNDNDNQLRLLYHPSHLHSRLHASLHTSHPASSRPTLRTPRPLPPTTLHYCRAAHRQPTHPRSAAQLLDV